jgi:hypothetical protein
MASVATLGVNARSAGIKLPGSECEQVRVLDEAST